MCIIHAVTHSYTFINELDTHSWMGAYFCLYDMERDEAWWLNAWTWKETAGAGELRRLKWSLLWKQGLFRLTLPCGSASEQVRIMVCPVTTAPPSALTCPSAIQSCVSSLSVWHAGCDLRVSLSSDRKFLIVRQGVVYNRMHYKTGLLRWC